MATSVLGLPWEGEGALQDESAQAQMFNRVTGLTQETAKLWGKRTAPPSPRRDSD